jgi:hypothetical protein
MNFSPEVLAAAITVILTFIGTLIINLNKLSKQIAVLEVQFGEQKAIKESMEKIAIRLTEQINELQKSIHNLEIENAKHKANK